MRDIAKIALMMSGLALTTGASPAFAGGCTSGYGGSCVGAPVVTNSHASFDPMTVTIEQPMGHLSSVNYTRAPNVSITRIHGMAPTASLSDAPSGFTGGCFPTSTQYCRSDAGTPISVNMNGAPAVSAPVMQAPIMQAPVMQAPVMAAPVLSAPLPAPRVVAIGGGYDPSKFTPRVYGDNTITPGIVHAPTSYIDRNPASAVAALGRASSMSYSMGSTSAYAGGSVQLGGTTTATSPSGTAYSGVDATGGYWEKVSGLTQFGNTVATQVICRRQAPAPKPVVVQQPQVNLQRVVRPVVGVPVPVPTPVPYVVNVPVGHIPAGCAPVAPTVRPVMGPRFAPPAMHMAPTMPMAPKPRVVPVPAPLPSGRWTY